MNNECLHRNTGLHILMLLIPSNVRIHCHKYLSPMNAVYFLVSRKLLLASAQHTTFFLSVPHSTKPTKQPY